MFLVTSLRIPGAISILRHASHWVVFYFKKLRKIHFYLVRYYVQRMRQNVLSANFCHKENEVLKI
jgi:hypothetical protein